MITSSQKRGVEMDSKRKSDDQEKEKKLKLNKRTVKDLNPTAEKVKGGVVGTGPVSDTCRTICKGHC
jgi:hypothetical protein